MTEFRIVEEYGFFENGATIRWRLQKRENHGDWESRGLTYSLDDVKVVIHHIERQSSDSKAIPINLGADP